MKRILSFCLLFTCLAARINAASTEEEQKFVAAVKSAFEKRDAGALAALTCWDRVPEQLIQRQKRGYAAAMKWEVKEISLVKPEQPDREWKDKSGVAYKFNLPIVKWLKPAFPSKAKMKTYYSVGEKDGKLFLAAQAPVKQ